MKNSTIHDVVIRIINFFEKLLDYLFFRAGRIGRKFGVIVKLVAAILAVFIFFAFWEWIIPIDSIPILVLVFLLSIILWLSSAGYRVVAKVLIVVLAIGTAYLFIPGRYSTLVSKWNGSDNDTFDDYQHGRKIEKSIQDDFKNEEISQNEKAEELLKNGDRKGALELLKNYVKDGESLKQELDTINALRGPVSDEKAQTEHIDTPQEKVTYGKPWVEKLGPNKVRVHFLPNSPLETGLKMKIGCDIIYTNVTAPFQILWTDNSYRTFYSDCKWTGKQNGKDIVVHGFNQPGSVDVEVKM